MSETIADPPVILFVDDEAPILSALRRLFRPQGYRVLLAESGAAGLALLEKEPIDLVVSDMRMPEMDGAQFLERVRERWPQVVRILLTGYADIGSTIAAINRGEIHRYIAKPWEDQDLLLAVADGLERRRLVAQNQALQKLTEQQNEALRQANNQLEARVAARTQELEQINAMLDTAYAQLKDNFLLSMDVFSGLIELRNGGSAGHGRRVGELARRIAQQLDGGPQLEQDTYLAGLLHEIGKIGFPDAMLGKPLSTLTGEDLVRFRHHPLNGEAALLPLQQLQRVAKYVRSQHERIDGLGFPDGLSGDEVPWGAQVLAIAADFYGLQTGRLSEQKQSEAAAASLILGGAGTHYQVDIARAFEAVLNERQQEEPNDQLVDARDVMPGMVLARDLTTPQGTLLLAAGFEFDERVVRQVKEFVQRQGAKLSLYVQRDPSGAKEALRHV